MKFMMHSETTAQDMAQGVQRRVLVHNEDLMMVEVHFEKGAIGALHSHPHQQMSYILSGSFEFENDGEKRLLGKGDSVLLAGGVLHGVLCTEEGTVLDVFNPERKDFL
ncbi:MAG: cupin domain-containing protein [Sphaerochaeta sp.]|nr:cupin domain-containing protein [Sphaerochaeta sp.]